MPILLNVDAGELEGEPEALTRLAHLVSVACGGHAGDEASMARAVARAAAAGTALGAHPSYPDRAGFGRRSLSLSPGELEASIEAQCAALRAIAEAAGIRITHAKPHGALYHDGARDPELSRRVLAAIVCALGPITLLGPPEGGWREAAVAAGLSYLREGFADRRMREDGSLVPRGEPGALLEDPAAAAAQARALVARGGLETICVHGDGPHAVAIARAVRDELGG